MKKFLFLFSLTVALSFSTKAQTSVYHPFPDSDAVWNIRYMADNAPFGCISWPWYEEDYSYILSSDTIIHGFSYHKIYTPFIQQNSSVSCLSNESSGYSGGIRQDIPNKKVYFLWYNDSTEKLLYDFNLQIGDTLKSFDNGFFCDSTVLVKSIDSILIDNTYRKRWQLYYPNSSQSPTNMVEGIGLETGLLEGLHCPGVIDAYSYQLTCFQQNGKTLYPDSTTTCDIISSVNNLSEKNISITLSPNPFHTTATLTISDNSGIASPARAGLAMTIYDVMGRVVRAVAVGSGSNPEIKIERGDLNDGLYFYRLSNDDGLLLTGKFVVD